MSLICLYLAALHDAGAKLYGVENEQSKAFGLQQFVWEVKTVAARHLGQDTMSSCISTC